MPVGGQVPGMTLTPSIGAHRVERVLEEGPEPGREEHHLRDDEQHHPVAQADLHDRRVVARLALGDHVGPPGVHGVEHDHEADQRDPGPAVVEPQHRAAQHDDGADRAGERPDARRQDVVVVVLVAGHRRSLYCSIVWPRSAGAAASLVRVRRPAAASSRQVGRVHGIGERDLGHVARLAVVEHRRIDVEAHRHLHPLAAAAAPACSKQKQAILSK